MEKCLTIDAISNPHELSGVRHLQLKAGGR